MLHYFAPMEGLTDSVYRRFHHACFPGLDRYYMPFFSPTQHRALTNREKRELPPAQSVPFTAIPQLLTRIPADFLWMSQQCADLGYSEVNLNLGCPSGTVVSKGKGSGMLADPDGLDRFLDTIFSGTPIAVSIKTRLGMENADEFPRLLDIFNRYPISELILHPRVRRSFYSGHVDLQLFSYCASNSHSPVCFNGDLHTINDAEEIARQFPQIHSVMLGRGLIGNPGMFSPGGTTTALLEMLFNQLLDEYIALFGGSRNAMFRLKEHWSYLIDHFPGSESLYRRLRKTTDIGEYRSITREIFQTLPFVAQVQSDSPKQD